MAYKAAFVILMMLALSEEASVSIKKNTNPTNNTNGDSYVKAYRAEQNLRRHEAASKERPRLRSIKDFPNGQWWSNSRQVRNKRVNEHPKLHRINRLVSSGSSAPHVVNPGFSFVPLQAYTENLHEFSPMFDHSFAHNQKGTRNTSQRFKTEGVNALTKAALYNSQAQQQFNQLSNYKGSQHLESLNALLGKKPKDQLKGFSELLNPNGNNHKLTYDDLINSHINIDASSLDIKNNERPESYINISPDAQSQDNRQYEFKEYPHAYAPPKDHTPITENVQDVEAEHPAYTVKYVYPTEIPATPSTHYEDADTVIKTEHNPGVKYVSSYTPQDNVSTKDSSYHQITKHEFPLTNNNKKRPSSQIYTYFKQNDKLLYESRIVNNKTTRREDTASRRKRDLNETQNKTQPFIKSKLNFETEIFITAKDLENEARKDNEINEPEYYYYDDEEGNFTDSYEDNFDNYYVANVTHPSLNCSDSKNSSNCFQDAGTVKVYASAYNHTESSPHFESLIRRRRPLYRIYRGTKTRVYRPNPQRFQKLLVKKPKGGFYPARKMPVNIFDNMKFSHLPFFLNDNFDEKRNPFPHFSESDLVDSSEVQMQRDYDEEDDPYRARDDYEDSRNYEDVYGEDLRDAGTQMFHRYAPFYNDYEDYSEGVIGPLYRIPNRHKRRRPETYDAYDDSSEFFNYKRKNIRNHKYHEHHNPSYDDDCVDVEFVKMGRPKHHRNPYRSSSKNRNRYRGHRHPPWFDRHDRSASEEPEFQGEPRSDYAQFLFNDERKLSENDKAETDIPNVYNDRFNEVNNRRFFKLKKLKKNKFKGHGRPRTKEEKKRHVQHLQRNINKLNAKLRTL